VVGVLDLSLRFGLGEDTLVEEQSYFGVVEESL
jgi:hypothetical protein